MKKILILNRRDIKNPLAGGAEIYTHEIFKRLADEFDLTHFSSAFKGCSNEEVVDNMRYLREGNELTIHLFGFLYVLRNNETYDLIIDQFNGIGFMTFKFEKSILLIHQLYGDFWKAKLGCAGILFEFLEKILLKMYRNKRTITVSNSTRDDLLRLGYDMKKNYIIPNGVNQILFSLKERFEPIVMYLGRLVKTKNPEDAIKAFLMAKEEIKNLKLYIAGEGAERQYLEKKYSKVSDIRFLGYVSEEKKYELLREASVLLVPSIREGWGQVVIQANITGTPAIGYDVEGLRDSVINGETGILVNKGEVEGMSDRIVYLFNNLDVLRKLSGRAREYAMRFSWEKSAEKMRGILVNG